MIYFEWATKACLSLAMKLFAMIASPVIALFADKNGWLPSYLSWFQTPDNSLDGDGGWRKEHWQWRYKLPTALATYVGRVGWLMRNSAYGFEIDVIGKTVPPHNKLTVVGNNFVTDRYPQRGFVMRRLFDNSGKLVAFQFYAVYPWCKTKCLRIMAGWKIWQFPRANTNLQLALNFNPFKSYKQ